MLKAKEFSENQGKYEQTKINLYGTTIIEVPSSIEHLNGLEDFNFS